MLGDWFILARMSAEEGETEVGVAGVAADGPRGVLKAPVLCFCRRSKISCSSLGRRGGAGESENGADGRGVVLRARNRIARRERWRGARRSVRVDCIVIAVDNMQILAVRSRRRAAQTIVFGD